MNNSFDNADLIINDLNYIYKNLIISKNEINILIPFLNEKILNINKIIKSNTNYIDNLDLYKKCVRPVNLFNYIYEKKNCKKEVSNFFKKLYKKEIKVKDIHKNDIDKKISIYFTRLIKKYNNNLDSNLNSNIINIQDKEQKFYNNIFKKYLNKSNNLKKLILDLEKLNNCITFNTYLKIMSELFTTNIVENKNIFFIIIVLGFLSIEKYIKVHEPKIFNLFIFYVKFIQQYCMNPE
jgi:hypothetical protein